MRDWLARLECFITGGHMTITASYTPVWIVVDGQEVPAHQAYCLRCPWAGYRTTWGALIKAD